MKRKEENHGNDSDRWRLVGRLELEIEIWARHVLGCDAEELTAWVGSVLGGLRAERQLDVEAVSGMQGRAAGAHKRLREMALDSGARGSGASARSAPRGVKRTRKRRASSLKGKRQDWWWKLSKKQQDAIKAKRVKATARVKANRARSVARTQKEREAA